MSSDLTRQSHHRQIVGIMGDGQEAHKDLVKPLALWVAAQGYDLLTGGGQGVMMTASEAFFNAPERTGIVIGIIPGAGFPDPYHRDPRYPNKFVELPIYTHLPDSGKKGMAPTSRNHINILTAQVIIAFPGGSGTRSEIELALAYGRPILLHGKDDGSSDPLVLNWGDRDWADRVRGKIGFETDPSRVQAFVQAVLGPQTTPASAVRASNQTPTAEPVSPPDP